ncbi:stonustoxin subunit beta-like isoform X2 [Triplophysa dalaica]|uniref:stonustoxin subunit beta-like isoform X2 n=1 Tax=Triplophysa dalaica TaxID=1582913 RepID=UPI0024E00EF1|nr:stonustoxin subunit beta-like isoform X2 [Triplophysa dalaica]
MESVGVNVMEAAALGRPFQLGMLYDCRKDALVPGITLWNQEKLQKSIRSRPQINTDFKVTASDSIDEKSHLLNIDGSLKLSLLGGLINVTGAAKYLNDTKKSFIQQRLTLHYHSTTRFEELTMNHLASENIAHPDVFDRDTATHVVTAVLYGADACFLFDREVSSDENKTTVEGEVKAAFDKLKFITVDVKANLNMSDVQREAVDKFTVTFYGDIQLPSNPTSFEDALKVFADLPKLLGGNRDLAVPLRVWLYPLNKLHSRASKLLKEISLDLISELESILESLNTTEIKCCDLLRDSPALALPEFHNQIKDMKKNCNTYKTRLMKKLGSLLPQIRGDQIEDSALNDLLNDHDKSPFRERDLSEWLKERERESKVMKTLLRQLKDSGATVEDNLQAILMDLNIGTVVSYTFTSLDWSDVLLPKQKAYLGSSRSGNSNDPESEKNLSWLTPAIHKTMRNNLDIFKKLIDLKKHEPVKFVVSSKQMKNHPGSCVLLYEDGCVEGVCLVNPSKPDPPKAEVKDDSVIINVAHSTCPATEELKLLYKMKDDQDWTSQPVLKSQNTVTLTDLRAGTEYEIKCAAVGKLSYTTESDVITVIKSHQTHSARSNSSVPYGLTNQGMTCYLNIVLQTLFMTIKYRKQLLSLKKDVTGAPPEEDISKTLAEFFKELEDKRPYIDTRKIIQAMHITNVHEQHDAAEYLQMILHKTPEPSKVFKGIVETTTTCFTCNNANRARTEFLSIPLSTDDKGKNDVNRALLEYQEVHMMCGDDQLYCVECDSLRDMETANIIIEWPDILILQLKRFEVFDSWSRVPYRKNEYKDDLEINSQKYELYVIINHRGSHSGGHYDALIKDETENWYHCDDKRVVKCSSKTNKLFEDRCMSAYLLFYRRHEEDEEPKKQTVTTDGKRENNQKPNKMKTTPEEQDMVFKKVWELGNLATSTTYRQDDGY